MKTSRFILMLGLMLGACKDVQYIPMKETVTETITETVTDTIKEVQLVPYFNERETRQDSSTLTNPYAYSFASWDGETLHHTLGIWPTAKADATLPVKERVVEKVVEKPVEVKVEVEKKLTLWQKIKIKTGGFALLVSLLSSAALLIFILKKTKT